MARGERFVLDLDEHDTPNEPGTGMGIGLDLVKDIAERPIDEAAPPPRPPSPRTTVTGFPEPKIKPLSRFKQKQQASQAKQNLPTGTGNARKDAQSQASANGTNTENLAVSERRQIDRENQEVLARMSEEEIARERAELLGGGVPGLTPSLIERLLKRANLQNGDDETSTATQTRSAEGTVPRAEAAEDETEPSASSKPRSRVTFAEPEPNASEDTHGSSNSPPVKRSLPQPERPAPLSHDPEAPPLVPPQDLQPVRSTTKPHGGPSIHFPVPVESIGSQTPLDTDSASFLSDLQERYFPHLAADPGTLAWMQPLPEATGAENAAYSPAADGVEPAALRFDFRGALVPPSVAATLPTTAGLHHHAQAPASAGYTIAELARLQRSVVPAQRALAHQTLGRLVFRLGQDRLGAPGDDLPSSLWRLLSTHRVRDNLLADASRDELATNRTAWAAATEALWLWRRAGGKAGHELNSR